VKLKQTYENFKMNLVGAMNLGLEALDKEIQKIEFEMQTKDKRIQELEARITELEKK